MDAQPLRLIVEDVVDGEKISLDRVPLELLKEFARDAEDFLAAGDEACEKLEVKIESGSLAIQALHPCSAQAYLDLAALHQNNDLSGVSPARARVIKRWQRAARAHPSRQYVVSDGRSTLVINHATNYHESDHSLWVRVTRKIVGQVQDMGGRNKANIHLATRNGVLIVDADQKTLADEQSNRLYKRVLVSITAEENTRTGDLRHLKLVRFEDYAPLASSEAMSEMRAAGEQAWNGIDAVEWVRRNREE